MLKETNMKIIITSNDNRPIYEQVTMQIKQAIMRGELKDGNPIPSIRFLAKDLKISVITVKRSYEDLEREGFIETYNGKGSFVKKQSLDLVREESKKDIESYLEKVAVKAEQIGTSYERLCEILKTKMKKGE